MSDLNEVEVIRFSEYLDGELEPADRAAFEAELVADPELQARFDDFARTLAALGSLEAPEVDLTQSVKRKIRRRSRGRYLGDGSYQRDRTQTQVFIVMALVVLVGVVVLAAMRHWVLFFGPEIHEIDGTETPDSEPEVQPDETPESADPGSGAATANAVPVGTPTERVPPRGITGDGPIAPLDRRDFVYTVHTALSADDVEEALVARFGSTSVRREGTRAIVTVAREALVESVDRASDIGSVSRTLGTIDAAAEHREFFVEPQP